MSKTKHLGLNVYHRQIDDNVLFEDWRMAVAGDESDSNMVLIDTAIGRMTQETAQAIADLLYSISVVQGRMATVEKDVGELSVGVDNTLTKPGQSADAKVTGDKLVELIQRLKKVESGEVELQTDTTLIQRDGLWSVNTASIVEEDNTLPVTSAAVFAEIGNIVALLETL